MAALIPEIAVAGEEAVAGGAAAEGAAAEGSNSGLLNKLGNGVGNGGGNTNSGSRTQAFSEGQEDAAMSGIAQKEIRG